VISRVRELIDGVHARPAAFETGTAAVSVEARPMPSAHTMTTPEPWRPEPKTPSVMAKLHEPAPRLPAPEPAMPSEDYFDFDRLDAAFARLGGEQEVHEPAPRQRDDYAAGFDVPTVDSLLASAPLRDRPDARIARAPTNDPPSTPDISSSGAASFVGDNAPGGRNVIADVFSALFAVEQGEPDATPLRLAAPQPAPVITDELVDEITRRVLQRLAPNAAHDLVAQIVSEVAERLIREEIARIKSAVDKRR
jgi:hypothetical protein